MFTGIVEAIGTVRSIAGGAEGARLTIDARGMELSDVATGDSMAVNGVCLTAVVVSKTGFQADVSKETWACVSAFKVSDEVNLEKAMRLSDRLGGHLVAGHVDGMGTVVALNDVAGNRVVTLKMPQALARYVARKGSIALNGVSLTINDVSADTFSVNLIPYTLAMTNLKYLTPGTGVNLEVDMIARYVERMTAREKA